MELYDEEEVLNQKKKNNKMKNYIKIGIILTTILIIALMIGIYFLIQNPNKITVYVDITENEKLENLILTKESAEDDSTIIYLPIKELANILGFNSYDGGGQYTGTGIYQDKNSCSIVPKDEGEGEVAIFTVDSNVICRIGNSKESNDKTNYEYIEIDNPIIRYNDNLYVDLEGIEVGFNTIIQPYNEKTKKITITTIDNLIKNATKKATKNGYEKIDEDFTNKKAILDNMIVVKALNGKKAVINYSTEEIILQPLYDEIIYVPQKKLFIVEDNSKVGIIGNDGITKINLKYDKLLLIDSKNDLYMAQSGNRYGVIDINENPIIHLDYDKIGVDISEYAENGVKNGYVLLDKLIPVQQNGNWGFFVIESKKESNGKNTITAKKLDIPELEGIGCINKLNSKLVSNIMLMEDYGLVVVQRENYYGFMNVEGGVPLGMLYTNIYMETSGGNTKYYMVRNVNGQEQVIDILKYFEEHGIKKTK